MLPMWLKVLSHVNNSSEDNFKPYRTTVHHLWWLYQRRMIENNKTYPSDKCPDHFYHSFYTE